MLSDPPPTRPTVTVRRVGDHLTACRTARDEDGRRRLEREAAVLRSLGEVPGVAGFVALRRTDEAVTLHTRWVGTETLASSRHLAASRIATLAFDLATTLAALHEAGVVHGRLTPDNVLIDADGHPVLCGLGRGDEIATAGDDIADFGRLLAVLVATPRPRGRRRPGDPDLRAALSAVADEAMRTDSASRPSMAEVARRVGEMADGAPPGTTGTAIADHLARLRVSTPSSRGRVTRPRLARAGAVAGAVAVVGAVVAVTGMTSVADHPASRPPQRPSALVGPVDHGEPPAPPGDTTTSATTTPAPCAVTTAPGVALAFDLDGDACRHPFRVDDRVVSIGEARWELGSEGDVVAVADFTCDARATAVVLRPASGEVFVFQRWASAGETIDVAAVAVVEGATSIEPRRRAGRDCSVLDVTLAEGRTVTLPERAFQ